MTAEVDETQNHVKPVILETFSLANDVRCVIYYVHFTSAETTPVSADDPL